MKFVWILNWLIYDTNYKIYIYLYMSLNGFNNDMYTTYNTNNTT